MGTLTKRLEELEVQRDELTVWIDELKQEIAENACPFVVGMEVAVCGYASNGKPMLIEEICGMPRPTKHSTKSLWRVRGSLIKKNGEPSKLTATFTDAQYKKAMK